MLAHTQNHTLLRYNMEGPASALVESRVVRNDQGWEHWGEEWSGIFGLEGKKSSVRREAIEGGLEVSYHKGPWRARGRVWIVGF